MTLTDTGPLVAIVNVGEVAHARCDSLLPDLSAPLLTTWPCMTEAMYLLGKTGGYRFQKALWRLRTSGLLIVHELSLREADRMQILMDKYHDAPMDLADASLVAVAETLSLRTVFTIDSHFYAYRTADGQAFQVVP